MKYIYLEEYNKWHRFFIDRGISDNLIDKYLGYIGNIVSSGLPVIFEIEHLSKLIGINLVELEKMIASPQSFYREFTIPKKRGGRRAIVSPYPSLLMCQKWIYENILKHIPSHFCTHAYKEKKSILTNAKNHLNQKAILKMDICDFFPSIPINWVIQFFSSLGYSNNVSYSLASICCLYDSLPQGAATSPALSNILLKSLDSRLFRLSKSYKLNYSRYADDLVFSGNYIPHKLIYLITQIVNVYNLNINEKKTSLIIGKKQKIVTGLSVQGKELRLPRSKRREIKKEIYFIKKFGLVSHISKLKIKNPYYLQSLEGKLRFWLQVEPNNETVHRNLQFVLSLK